MLGQTHPFHEGEGHPLSRVFICIKQLACCYLHMLQAGFLRWTGLLKTPLLIGTLADLPKGKFELVAENEQHVEKWLLNHVSNLLLAFNHAQISR